MARVYDHLFKILLVGDSGTLIPCASADEAWQMRDGLNILSSGWEFTMGDVEKSTFIICPWFSTFISLLPRILFPCLCYNCLYSAGVGKTDLLLRFADNLFSGMFLGTALSCIKWLSLWVYCPGSSALGCCQCPLSFLKWVVFFQVCLSR